MARGLLISFAGLPVSASSFFPDNGLASLAGTLLAQGHEVKILDYNRVDILSRIVSPERTASLATLAPALGGGALDPQVVQHLMEITTLLDQDLARVTDQLAEELAAEVAAQGSHFVGFKLWPGDGFLASVKMAEHLRGLLPEIKIYGGGPAVLYSEETIYEYTRAFDALVDGEGEQAIIGLALFAEGRQALGDIPNLILMEGEVVRRTHRSQISDLNELALPNYSEEVYPSLVGSNQIKLFILDESRGCPMGCAFCIHQFTSGNTWRTKAPSRILWEIHQLQELHNMRSFRFGGSNTPAFIYQGISEALISEGANLAFSGFAHANGLPLDQLELYYRAGCRSLFFGVESFSPADLQRLGKRLDPELAQATLRACLDRGIAPIVSLIYPVPGSTEEDRAITLKATVEICGGTHSSATPSLPGLVPHTLWWNDRKRYGLQLKIEEKAYMKFVSSYKVAHILPLSLWAPLPYSIGGESSLIAIQANANFRCSLAQRGVLLGLADTDVLISNQLTMSLSKFCAGFKEIVFTLDTKQAENLCAKMNSQNK